MRLGGRQRRVGVDGVVADGDRGVGVTGQRVSPGESRQVQTPKPGIAGAVVVHGMKQQWHRPPGGVPVTTD